jgi:hypothetical protein
MVQAQHDLDRATGLSHREILCEVVRECAREYRVREYPTCETH